MIEDLNEQNVNRMIHISVGSGGYELTISSNNNDDNLDALLNKAEIIIKKYIKKYR